MKIIFWGSDDFAALHLKRLIDEGFELTACVTHPDKPQGRHLKLVPSPIKEIALAKKIPLLQPDKVKDAGFIKKLKTFNSEVFVVVAYGYILPAEILEIPSLCPINVHASLLPKYRGAAPINWAIMNGEKETGVCLIKMNAQLDAGDIFSRAVVKIGPQDTSVTLREKLAKAGAELLIKTLKNLESKNYTLAAQNHREATYAPKLTKELGAIDWTKSAAAVHNLVRGLLPWPTAHTQFKGKLLKVVEVEPIDSNNPGEPGQAIEVTRNDIIVKAGEGAVRLLKVHPESGKVMDAKSFTAGYKVKAGDKFG